MDTGSLQIFANPCKFASQLCPNFFFLNTFPFYGWMSLPQTVYFSISNFLYELTQPTVHCTSPSNLNVLTIKQKTAIRIINNSTYNSHTELIFKSFSMFSPWLIFLNTSRFSSCSILWMVNYLAHLSQLGSGTKIVKVEIILLYSEITMKSVFLPPA